MKRSIRKVIYWSVMILFLIIQGYPIIWLIIAGFRPNIELLTQPFGFPKSFTMENFIKIFITCIDSFNKFNGIICHC